MYAIISGLMICSSITPGNGCVSSKPDAIYVEFDLSPLAAAKRSWDMKLIVRTSDKDISYVDKIGVGPTGVGDVGVMCETIVKRMTEDGFKAEIVNKTKIRVYGRPFNDKLIPATEGIIESKDLKKNELPKINNPPKA